MSAGSARGTPSSALAAAAAPRSSALMFSQRTLCSAALGRPRPANTCGWRLTSLSQIAPAAASKSKTPRSRAICA